MKRVNLFFLGASLCAVFLASNAFSNQIEFIREISDPRKEAGQKRLHSPRAIAMGMTQIFIADTDAHRVLVLDHTGKELRTWGSKGTDFGQFKSPSGIALDENGRIYVADTDNHRVQVFRASGTFFRSIGEKGSGDLEFSSPSGIAVRNGLIYVADSGNSRIQVLTTDGIFIRTITPGDQHDAMKTPVAVIVDGQNKIYALDTDDDSVRVFDLNGAQLLAFGKSGKGAEKLDSPQGMTVDSFGNIYIADTGNYKVKKFNHQGQLLTSQGSRGDGPGQFKQMLGMAIYKNNLFILDAERNSLQIFSCEYDGDAEGKDRPLAASPPATVSFEKEIRTVVDGLAFDKQLWALANDQLLAVGASGGRSIASRGSDPGKLKNPLDLAFDWSGNFWIADTGNDRLQKFGVDGNLLLVVGKSGSDDAEFDSPAGVAVSASGNVYVADTGNNRVQIFTANGMFVSLFGKSGTIKFDDLADIEVDGKDCMYAVDRGNDSIAKYNAGGSRIWEIKKSGSRDGEFNAPDSIVLSPDGELYVLDAGNARVQVFDMDGRFRHKFGSEGAGPGQFKSPHGLTLEKNYRLYVGDRGNGRVQVFSLHQTPSVPTEVTARSRTNEVHVRWRGGRESYLEEYNIYRGETEAGPFKLVKKQREPVFIDKELPSRRTFYYRISSKAKEGYESMASSAVAAITPKLMPTSPGRVRIEAVEKQMKLSWPPNPEPYVNQYNVYRTYEPSRGFDFAATVDKNEFVDTGLDDGTVYHYRVTAVSKEGDESSPGEPVFAATPRPSATLPPLEVTKVEIDEIFSSAYKYYESHPAGRVIITNNTDISFKKVKVVFSIKDFMDFPTEADIEQVLPKQKVEIALKPVFNNKILGVTENTPLQSEIALTFYSGGEPNTIKSSFPLMLYERHAVVWDQKERIGAFVTPKDPPVADFTTDSIRPYVNAKANIKQSIVYARAIFDALGKLGVKNIVDPSRPFEKFSEKRGVDYLQYPRDTLFRKSGDCDDLSILFAASLKNVGINTAFIDVPGHVFVMFNTGVRWTERKKLGFSPELLIPFGETAWVPVEMTMVGQSFNRAWQYGADKYSEWSTKGKADITGTIQAWQLFKPVTLPSTEQKTRKIEKKNVKTKHKKSRLGIS